jgi:primosomal protein N' (replication factor Y)
VKNDLPPVEYSGSSPTYAEVAVDGAFAYEGRGVLTYAVPAAWAARLGIGQLVWAPLRKQVTLGIVMNLHTDTPDFKVRPLQALVEPQFRLSDDQLEVATWLARETASTLFDAASPYLPPGATHRVVEWLRLADSNVELPADLTPLQKKVTDYLREHESASIDTLRQALGKSLTTVIAKLEERGVVERTARVTDRLPRERSDRYVRLLEPLGEIGDEAPRQQAFIDYLSLRKRLAPAGRSAFVPLRDVLDRTGTDHGVVSALARK